MGLSSNPSVKRNAVVWVIIVGLAFLSVTLGLSTVPNAAIQYWYLNFSPLILAAYRFGLRGALVGSVISMLSILWYYQVALGVTLLIVQDVEALVSRATSPGELQSLAVRLGDLRARDPYTNFVRAVSGSMLLVVGGVLVGLLTDRSRAQEVQYRAVQRLRQFFSPAVAEAIVSSQHSVALTSSRKPVTVMFADLRGFTPLSEHLEPEELSHLLNEYLSAMTAVIFKYDGTLDKYIGDGIMAFFGDPIPSDQHEESAIRAALEMRGRFYELLSTWYLEGRETITLGIGIHSGFVTVGNFGSDDRMEYTAIGNNVNLASRLSDLAEPGQILTTQRTHAKVRHLVEGRAVGEMEVSGFGHPVEVVEVLGYRLIPAVPSDRPELEHSLLHKTIERIVDDGSYRAWIIRDAQMALGGLGLEAQEQAVAQQVAVLTGYPLFRGVGARETLLLMELAALETFQEGVVITRQGEKESKFYIIYNGEAAVLVTGAQGREQHVATLGRGNHFGELGLLYDRPRNATIRAGTSLELLSLDPENFHRLLRECSTLARNIEREAQRRLAN